MRSLVPALVLCCACATTSASTAKDDGPTPIVAKYGDRVIRQGEVDARITDDLTKLQEQIFELREDTAERIAVEALIAQKAKAAGQTEDEWLSINVEAGVQEPSDEAMRALFERAQARLPAGVGYEDVKPQLKAAVARELRGKRVAEVFSKLKKEAGFTMVMQGPPKQRKEVDATGPSRGNEKAKITIVEFADFECPYCAKAHETVMSVLKSYGDKVRIVFRHYPLSFHPKAPKAAEATACAGEQGKFWEMHDALFESQELEVEALKAQASRTGVDEAKFSSCLDSGRMASLVKKDMAAGQKAGVSGTPAFFINGLMISGAQPEAAFHKIIDAELDRLGN